MSDPFDDFERAMAQLDWDGVDAAMARMDREEAESLQEAVQHAKSYQKWARWKQSRPDGTRPRR